MKKGLFLFAFALLGIFSFGQSLRQGNLLGLHVFTPHLKDGITMQEYIKFYTGTVIPKYEKAFPGVKGYLLKSIRGQDSSSMAVMFVFVNEADRNKYWKSDGSMTAAGDAANAKLNDLGKEVEKYEVSSNDLDRYNDWLVQ